MNKTIEYFKEVRAEMKNVTWPTRKQTMFFTLAVLIVSLFVAYYLGALDKVFSKGLEWVLTK
ncbi:MAG: preprotein translocase subunit SecE [Patescibacteria group bacterium]